MVHSRVPRLSQWSAQGAKPDVEISVAGERTSQRQLQAELEKQVLKKGCSAEFAMIEAASVAEQRGVTPAWRVERRLREFLEILRDSGAVNTEVELQRIGLKFARRYGTRRLPSETARDLLKEAKADLGDLRVWRKLPQKKS
jgi:hypothetical protein